MQYINHLILFFISYQYCFQQPCLQMTLVPILESQLSRAVILKLMNMIVKKIQIKNENQH